MVIILLNHSNQKKSNKNKAKIKIKGKRYQNQSIQYLIKETKMRLSFPSSSTLLSSILFFLSISNVSFGFPICQQQAFENLQSAMERSNSIYSSCVQNQTQLALRNWWAQMKQYYESQMAQQSQRRMMNTMLDGFMALSNQFNYANLSMNNLPFLSSSPFGGIGTGFLPIGNSPYSYPPSFGGIGGGFPSPFNSFSPMNSSPFSPPFGGMNSFYPPPSPPPFSSPFGGMNSMMGGGIGGFYPPSPSPSFGSSFSPFPSYPPLM